MAGKDNGPAVDQRLLNVSTYKEVFRGGVGVVVCVCMCGSVCGDRRPHPGSFCVITRHRRPSFLSSLEREMKDKRDRGL